MLERSRSWTWRLKCSWTHQLAVLILAICWSVGAQAASITLLPPSEISIIEISGEIAVGDENTFDLVATTAMQRGLPTVVVLASPGGGAYAGIEIGLTVHRAGFRTLVPNGSICASACADIWLGGRGRFAGDAASIGFHQVYDGRTMEPSILGNAVGAHYLGEIGLPRDAVFKMIEKGPSEMGWLSFREADNIGITVQAFGDRIVPSQLAGDAMGRHGGPRSSGAPPPQPPVARNERASTTCPSGEVVPAGVDCTQTGSIPRARPDTPPTRSPVFCAECLASMHPDHAPNRANIQRAIGNMTKVVATRGPAALHDVSTACWSRFEQLRTARSMQYCFVVDLIGSTHRLGGRFDGVAVRTRMDDALLRLTDRHVVRPDHLDVWWSQANGVVTALR